VVGGGWLKVLQESRDVVMKGEGYEKLLNVFELYALTKNGFYSSLLLRDEGKADLVPLISSDESCMDCI